MYEVVTQNWHREPSEAQIERQIRWELNAVEEGARRTREALQSQGLGNSVVGHRLIRTIAKPMVEVVREEQQKAALTMANPAHAKSPYWMEALVSISPDKLTVIVLNTVLSSEPREGGINYPVSRLARTISDAVQVQIDFDQWEAEQKKLKKETDEMSELDKYLRFTKKVDRKSWDRFRWKQGRARANKWGRDCDKCCQQHGTSGHLPAGC